MDRVRNKGENFTGERTPNQTVNISTISSPFPLPPHLPGLRAFCFAGQVYLRDCTAVTPGSLLLFGGEVAVDHLRGTAEIDGWVQFRVCGRTAVLCKELRSCFDELLLAKARDPALEITAHPLTSMITRVLAHEAAS